MTSELDGNDDSFEIKLNKLNKTFDIFLRRRFDRESAILKSDIQKAKEIIKEKLGVDIDSRS